MSGRREHRKGLPRSDGVLVAVIVATLGVACVRNTAPVEPEAPEPPVGANPITPPPAPLPASGEEALPVPELIQDEEFLSRSLEEINQAAPLEPVFFAYDSSDLNEEAMVAIRTNLEQLSRNPTWIITIEGHCDERGTPEYNLALGERRALVVRDQMRSLGLSETRVRTISYGKEFPFDPASNSMAWARNRRAHFVITAQ